MLDKSCSFSVQLWPKKKCVVVGFRGASRVWHLLAHCVLSRCTSNYKIFNKPENKKKLLFDFTRFLHVCFTPSIYIFVGSETLFKDSCTSILKDLACVSCFAKFSFHSLSQSNNFCCSWNTWVLSFAISSSYSFKLLCKWVIVWPCSYDEVKRRCV